MKDGHYTVRKVEKGSRKEEIKVLLVGVPKVDCIYSTDLRLQKGSEVRVKGGKIVNTKV